MRARCLLFAAALALTSRIALAQDAETVPPDSPSTPTSTSTSTPTPTSTSTSTSTPTSTPTATPTSTSTATPTSTSTSTPTSTSTATATSTPTPTSVDVSKSPHVALGIPRDGDDSDDYLMDKGSFVVSYNPRLNAANWVAWRLEKADLGPVPRAPRFHSDASLPRPFYTVVDHDFAGSGYDRGHLCPSADRTRDAAYNETTFVFTNVHAQRHALNAGPWEDLEKHERELAKAGDTLYIVAGGIFDANPPRVGHDPDVAHRVAVPKESFKVILALPPGMAPSAVGPTAEPLAVIIPNTADVEGRPFTQYRTTIRDVERATRYDFEPGLPAQVADALELR